MSRGYTMDELLHGLFVGEPFLRCERVDDDFGQGVIIYQLGQQWRLHRMESGDIWLCFQHPDGGWVTQARVVDRPQRAEYLHLWYHFWPEEEAPDA